MQLERLEEGMQLVYDGDQLFTVDKALSDQFSPGDKLVFVSGFDRPVCIPKQALSLVDSEIDEAIKGFYDLSQVSDDQIDSFFDSFSENLANDSIWNHIKAVNDRDVEKAKAKGRSTTRLIANDRCRENMVAGLKDFQRQAVTRVQELSEVNHEGWGVQLMKSPLGVVGFVFEGRPNVIADATGVLKSGNSVVFRIGQDALDTATAIVEMALYPALDKAGISRSVIRLIQSPERATAWALFSNPKVNLAVARGSGDAVRMLGGIAKQYGVPVSLHGTGGAWMMTDEETSKERLRGAIIGSLDRKVCNTLNTLCVLKSRASELIPVALEALNDAATTLGQSYKLHVEENSLSYLDQAAYSKQVVIQRASGPETEPQCERISEKDLGNEWEWEESPEVTLVVVDSLEDAARLFNQYSPQFVASLVTENSESLSRFFNMVNAPFVGNGMTRWVDGQYALKSPELGLSNWESGRFLARSAILSGDSVFTTRIKMVQSKIDLRR